MVTFDQKFIFGQSCLQQSCLGEVGWEFKMFGIIYYVYRYIQLYQSNNVIENTTRNTCRRCTDKNITAYSLQGYCNTLINTVESKA